MKTKKIIKTTAAVLAMLCLFLAVSVKDDSKGEIVMRGICVAGAVGCVLVHNSIEKENKSCQDDD